jgi:hypothetical protein
VSGVRGAGWVRKKERNHSNVTHKRTAVGVVVLHLRRRRRLALAAHRGRRERLDNCRERVHAAVRARVAVVERTAAGAAAGSGAGALRREAQSV